MVIAIGRSVTVALGQLPTGVEQKWAQSRACSADPSYLPQGASLCKDTSTCSYLQDSNSLVGQLCFSLEATFLGFLLREKLDEDLNFKALPSGHLLV